MQDCKAIILETNHIYSIIWYDIIILTIQVRIMTIITLWIELLLKKRLQTIFYKFFYRKTKTTAMLIITEVIDYYIRDVTAMIHCQSSGLLYEVQSPTQQIWKPDEAKHGEERNEERKKWTETKSIKWTITIWIRFYFINTLINSIVKGLEMTQQQREN